jgi:hypothetical protein
MPGEPDKSKRHDMLTTFGGNVLGGAGATILDPSAASLARELAQDIRPADAILADYGFSGSGDPLWQELCASAEFRRLLEQAQREWNAADTTKRRIQLKAQASLEASLPNLHALMVSERVDPADRVNATKVMRDLAGMALHPNAAGPGDGSGGLSVKIVINGQEMVKSVSATPVIEHESGLREATGEDA